MNSNTTPTNAAPALSAASPAVNPAPTPAAPPASPVQAAEPVGPVTTAGDDAAIIAQNDRVELLPAPANDDPVLADRTLPQTAGHSNLELMTGLILLCAGVTGVLASRCKS